MHVRGMGLLWRGLWVGLEVFALGPLLLCPSLGHLQGPSLPSEARHAWSEETRLWLQPADNTN